MEKSEKVLVEKEKTKRARLYDDMASKVAIIFGIILMVLTIFVTFIMNVS